MNECQSSHLLLFDLDWLYKKLRLRKKKIERLLLTPKVTQRKNSDWNPEKVSYWYPEEIKCTLDLSAHISIFCLNTSTFIDLG